MELPRCHYRNLVPLEVIRRTPNRVSFRITANISYKLTERSSTVTLQKQEFKRAETLSFDLGFVC